MWGPSSFAISITVVAVFPSPCEGTATTTATATTAPKLRLSEQAVVTPDNSTSTTKRTTPTAAAAAARTTITAGTTNAAGTTTSSAAILSKETRDSVVASMEVVMKTKVCNNSKQNRKSTWSPLCKGGISQRLKQLIQSPSLSESNRIRIVQIGAHTGWDENDPFIGGMTHLLDALPRDFRQRFVEYVFVEASPLFALVDTEGFDCNIILGTQILPRFLMYEVLHCSKENKEAAAKYLGSKGFTLSGQNKIPGGFENVVAVA